MNKMIKTEVYKNKAKAFAVGRLVRKNGFKAEVIKLAYPKGQYLLYVSGEM